MLQADRHYTLAEYKFGFGSHEKIDEVSGSGNTVDMGDRWLDVRLGRTPKLDAKAKKYPDNSPYVYAANNPILFLDPDGKVVKAYTIEAQELVIQTMNYAFGEGHGFSFENNTLVHNGEIPDNLSSQQTLMLTYFNETLVKSSAITTVHVNKSSYNDISNSGQTIISGSTEEGNALTIGYKVPATIEKKGNSLVATILTPAQIGNEILISESLMQNGINLAIKRGYKVFTVEHALLHEFAHAIVNVIMNEMGGEFNGVNFNDMTETERDDWAIKYTNTLLKSKGYSLETGKGQHGRKKEETPEDENVEPLDQ
jgi:hypothetical protein